MGYGVSRELRPMTMDVLRLLSDLEEMIEAPRSTLGYIRLNRDDVGMQIAKIRASLPQEVKAAASTVRETERILETASEAASSTIESARREADRVIKEGREEAERILEQARLLQTQMVSESEVLKLSKAQSQEIRNQADQEAIALRRGAESYAYEVLTHLETVVGKVTMTIDKGKQEIGKPEPAPTAITGRGARLV